VNSHLQSTALRKYRQNVSKAQMVDLLSLITGSNTDLVSYDEVAKRLKARQQIDMGTQNVPLDKIIGSVGRYHDFTRSFLPRAAVNPDRWSRLDAAMNDLQGLPPVELYKIGDVYFVRDGNHRVSVARANDSEQIEAYVTEVKTDVPITVDDFEHDAWIIKAERAEFLQATRLDQLRPDNDFLLTEPGRYRILLRHIEVHRYFLNQARVAEGRDSEISWEEAVKSWYDHIYQPVIEAIHRDGLLDAFPHRTEADLYLWITHHREQLAATYGLAPLTPDAAVATFAETHDDNLFNRTVKHLRNGMHRRLGTQQPPLGMSAKEFRKSRARREAGEVSLGEVDGVNVETGELDAGEEAHCATVTAS
jgi:hypothetical protein